MNSSACVPLLGAFDVPFGLPRAFVAAAHLVRRGAAPQPPPP